MRAPNKLRETVAAFAREASIVTIAAGLIEVGLRWTNEWQAAKPRLETGASASAKRQVEVESPLTINGDHEKSKSLTLILVLSPTCPHCIRSQSFYKRLAAEAAPHSVRLVVAVPDKAKAGEFLAGAGLIRADLRVWADLSAAVSSTPTLLALDSGRVVRRVWVGRMNEHREAEILDLCRNPSKLIPRGLPIETGEANLNKEDLTRLLVLSRQPFTLVDVRERDAFAAGHQRGATNIPLSELAIRSSNELDEKHVIVVDCGWVDNPRSCRRAIEALSKEGFSRVAALNANLQYWETCNMTAIHE